MSEEGLQLLGPSKKRDEVMSSDSTSSEDEYEKIKEVVDENFLTQELYLKINGKSEKQPKNLSKPASLRNQFHQEISNNPFSIRVTPEFQRHVSKHLSRFLDKIIDDKEIIIKRKKLEKGHLSNGVKLLCSSKNFLLPNSNFVKTKKPKKSAVKENLNDSDYEKKAKEVAVTPEWVLSKEETRYWAPNTKGDIEIIKLDDSNKDVKKSKNEKKKTKS